MTEYRLVRTKRKSLSLSVDDSLRVVVRAPMRLSASYIDEFVRTHQDWIASAVVEKSACLEKYGNRTKDEIECQRERAGQYLSERTEYYSNILELKPAGIKITSAKKRFGSCSYKNSICFSLYLMDYPREAIDYVVVHELCHIRHKNHGAAFYKLIASVIPDYKERIKLLKKS